jgi:phosphotransferase system enzyme I (PtsP)
VLVDGDLGTVVVRPTRSLNSTSSKPCNMTSQRRRGRIRCVIRNLPPQTKDGTRITLMVNAGFSADDAAQIAITGADCGSACSAPNSSSLIAATLPGRESQQRLYKSVLDGAGDKPVVFHARHRRRQGAAPFLPGPSRDERESQQALARLAPQPRTIDPVMKASRLAR